MKKSILMIVVAATMLMISQVSNGQTGIKGSAHDFSTGFAWNLTGEICVVCHIPHGANTTVTNAPLWNHELSAVSSYQTYTSATFDALLQVTAAPQPDGSSKLCLSCHDGTVGLGDFGTITSDNTYIQTLTAPIAGSLANLGTNLTGTHPISFVYNTALALAYGKGLNDPSATVSGIGLTASPSTNFIAQDMLINNEMECTSCHDTHNKYGLPSLLIKSNSTISGGTASGLCLTCHNK